MYEGEYKEVHRKYSEPGKYTIYRVTDHECMLDEASLDVQNTAAEEQARGDSATPLIQVTYLWDKWILHFCLFIKAYYNDFNAQYEYVNTQLLDLQRSLPSHMRSVPRITTFPKEIKSPTLFPLSTHRREAWSDRPALSYTLGPPQNKCRCLSRKRERWRPLDVLWRAVPPIDIPGNRKRSGIETLSTHSLCEQIERQRKLRGRLLIKAGSQDTTSWKPSPNIFYHSINDTSDKYNYSPLGTTSISFVEKWHSEISLQWIEFLLLNL